jgi:hypothetical protein
MPELVLALVGSLQLRPAQRRQMAALKISRDVHAQLQSHGLGGIQAQHYDRRTYFAEKKQALQRWVRNLPKVQEIQASIPDSHEMSSANCRR